MKRIQFIILTACFLLADTGHTYSRTLNLKAGELKNLFKTYDLEYEKDLTLVGTINGSDLKVLRDWARDFRTLNLEDCRIVAGGEPYYEDYTTEDDVLGSYLFGDKEFKQLVLPWTLKKIGDYAISFCGDSINLPTSLTWLGDYAFVNNNFKKLHLPASLDHIGNAALNGNITLADVTLDPDNPFFVLEDGYLYTRDHSRLLSYFGEISSRVETFTIRPEVRTIDDKAFNFHRTYNITLNEGLEHIGAYAFRYALNNIAPHQKKLVIPNSVNYIGEYAFENCYMDEVVISDNVDSLFNDTFSFCFIDQIHMPAKLKYIGARALYNNHLDNLVLPEGVETIERNAFYDLNVDKLVIPESVKFLEEFAFYGCYMKDLEIKAPLDSIPKAAFYSCQDLKRLVLPPTIKRIGQSAFYECYRMTECKLPEGLEEIGSWALAGADHLKEWHIPASVRKIEWAAFAVPNFSSHTVYMYSEEPPAEMDEDAFRYWTMEQSVLCVPKGCMDNYREAPWSYFGTIKEFEPSGVSPVLRTPQDLDSRYYDLQGRPATPGSHGLRIEVTPGGARKVVR